MFGYQMIYLFFCEKGEFFYMGIDTLLGKR